jgi:acyl transferase domain-containing protein
MLEVTFEAFEDAGIKPDDVWGSRTGVYAGMWSSDFEHLLSNSKDDIDVYSTTGSGRYAAAGRLAYFFNLQGPTFTIDTACSTSLVAVHLAAQSLQLRESDLAVCSAANLILNPFISIGYSRSRLLSDYGKCQVRSSRCSRICKNGRRCHSDPQAPQ